jgi:predicted nucleic-acid-binding Zn-ribbon protein
MSEASLCAKCRNEPRCEPTIQKAEDEAFPIMHEAFRKCGAKAYVIRNVVLECDNFVER